MALPPSTTHAGPRGNWVAKDARADHVLHLAEPDVRGRDFDCDYSEALSKPDGGARFGPADIGTLGDPCHR